MLRSRNRITAAVITVFSTLATAGGFGTAAASSLSPTSASRATAPTPIRGGSPASSVTLPGGDRVLYQGADGHRTYNVVGPDGTSVPFLKLDPGNGHVYVLPDSALHGATSLDITQYDIPALSHSTASPKAAVSSGYPLRILQINANDTAGAPAQNAVSILVNVDSAAKFAQVIPDYGGEARVAIPVGNYAVYTEFEDYGANGVKTSDHLVLQDDLNVPDAGGALIDTADENAASSQITAATPRTATADYVTANVLRTDAAGNQFAIQATATGNVFISPEAAPTIGKLAYQTMWAGQSSAGTSSRYRYDLSFPTYDNIPANETYPVSSNQLATLHYALDTDAANTAHTGLYTMGAINMAIGGLSPSYPVTVPENLTDYITAPLPTGFGWDQAYQAELGKAPDNGYFSINSSDPLDVAAGHEYRQTWAHGPLAPQVGRFASGGNTCYDCVAGTNMNISFTSQASDSGPNTIGYFEVPFGQVNPTTMNFTLYRNGQQIDYETFSQGSFITDVSRQPDTYRAVFDVNASGFFQEVSQSTTTHTELTFVSNPAGDPNSVLPPDDTCIDAQDSSTPCQILPLLNLNYQLNTDGSDTSHGAVSVLGLTVGHLSFEGHGSQAPAASAKVEVSFDGGKTWKPAATVPTGQNHYLAIWPNIGAKGSRPSLRVSATDTIGGSITQTIADAYTVG